MNSDKKAGRQENNFWTPARAALTFLVFGLLASFGITSCNSSSNSSSTNANAPKITMTVNGANPAQPAGGNVPPPQMIPASALDASLKTVDGKDFKLSELKDKVLVLDLWATWCPPCRKEIPELVQMQEEY